jgi:hypothetical protein
MRTYHVVAEGNVTTNMTSTEIREDAHLSVMGTEVENQKVTVKQVRNVKKT